MKSTLLLIHRSKSSCNRTVLSFHYIYLHKMMQKKRRKIWWRTCTQNQEHYHLHIWGWWEGVSSQSDGEEQKPILSFSALMNPNSLCKKNTSLFSSTTFKIFSNTGTSHGILSTPSCWNPNSSSASRSRIRKAWCPKYSVGMMNLFSSFPTQMARKPLGTTSFWAAETSEKESVLLINFMLLLLLVEVEVELLRLFVLLVEDELVLGFVFLGAFASFFHFFRICWSLTISLILLDFFESMK